MKKAARRDEAKKKRGKPDEASEATTKKAAGRKSPREEDDQPIAGVRIIGGTFRGRNLQYSGDLRTRPMKDRTREAIFNLVGIDVIGRHVFDLFAGTGALGLEAMSRGAAKATLVERHLPTRNLIEDNIRTLGLEDRAIAVFSDAFMFARKLQPDEQGTSWVVFCSPPYELFVSRRDDMLAMIAGIVAKMPVGSTLIVETDEHFDTALLPDTIEWRVRKYYPAFVSIAEKTE
ncbi:Ribosomal RNA small subunit methyltransferase D [Anatilimnocola aggregata]|uniref:Ribosomal RNA small subunit methyltransferase D n=1 Tax=Anatilimnocola aggregata TaxID=2528021 RepID=A0A517Y7F5_9BACT|nr:RsmD family RNA methyltransferase [Anatilimnocola aggregata]QDU26072.1 Ribosomal RNA small subunit methyltransferase D [Anatilimnocola aggregata]